MLRNWFIKIFSTFFLLVFFQIGFSQKIDTTFYQPFPTNTFISLAYSNSLFQNYNSTPPTNTTTRSLHGGNGLDVNYRYSNKDYESFRTTELTGNLKVSSFLNLYTIIPYHYNIDYFDQIINKNTSEVFSMKDTYKGIGDIRIGFNYFKNKKFNANRNSLRLGAGYSLPTGKFTLINSLGNYENPKHLPGKGSYIPYFNGSYFHVFNEKWGFITDFNYMLANETKPYTTFSFGYITYSYKHGAKLNANLAAFYQVKIANAKFIPRLGIQYRKEDMDKLNTKWVRDSGGSTFYYQFGLDIHYQKILIQAKFSKPFQQKINGLQLLNQEILNLGMLISF